MGPMLRIPLLAGLGLAACCCAIAQPPAADAPLQLTLAEAMDRARQQSPQIVAANIAALLAREDTVQAKAALLPSANAFSQYLYTQPNGYPSGVFISNDAPHLYNNQLQLHGEIYNPVKLADYRKSQFAQAVAQARADLAARGLIAT